MTGEFRAKRLAMESNYMALRAASIVFIITAERAYVSNVVYAETGFIGRLFLAMDSDCFPGYSAAW